MIYTTLLKILSDILDIAIVWFLFYQLLKYSMNIMGEIRIFYTIIIKKYGLMNRNQCVK